MTAKLLLLAGVLLMTLAGRVHRKGRWAVALERQDPSHSVGTRWARRRPSEGRVPTSPGTADANFLHV